MENKRDPGRIARGGGNSPINEEALKKVTLLESFSLKLPLFFTGEGDERGGAGAREERRQTKP